MSFLNDFLLYLIKALYSIIRNYPITIIVFTIIIKLLIMPLNLKSRRSTMRMSALQPKMQELQNKYKDDRDKLNQKTQELYREEGVSPLGGCLPMVLSMVVLFAMFYALRTFANEQMITQLLTFKADPSIDPKTLVEPFLWIKNLWMPDSPFATFMPDVRSLQMVDFDVWNSVSAKLAASGIIPEALSFAGREDVAAYIASEIEPFINSEAYAPFVAAVPGLADLNLFGIIRFTIFKEGNGLFILPIFSMISQVFMQKITMQSTVMDPQQQSSQNMMMYVMLFMSFYFCAQYNAAFALYWVVSNIYAIAEQLAFTKYFKSQDLKSAKAEEVGI